MLKELSSARRHELHHSALMSGSATGALLKSSPGHHCDHSQSRSVCTSSQRQTGGHTLPKSGGCIARDKVSQKPRKIPRKQAL